RSVTLHLQPVCRCGFCVTHWDGLATRAWFRVLGFAKPFSTALLKAERAECDSSPATDHLVKKLETAVGDLKTIVQRGQDAVKCRTVHKYYVQIAYDYVCNEGTYDLEILLASVAAMAVLVAIPLITSRRIAAPLPYEDRIDYSYSEDDIPYEATRLSQNQHSQPTYGARS
ncbi:hypothetical protein SARC_05528, partial [Sphaeroforma arctica JP610]